METAEHQADKIFFACAAVSCGALFSSFAAFYEGEYRKVRVKVMPKSTRPQRKSIPSPWRNSGRQAARNERGRQQTQGKGTESKESGDETQGVLLIRGQGSGSRGLVRSDKAGPEPRKSCEPLETVCQCIFPGCGDVSYSSTVFCAAHGGTRNGTFPFPWLLH